MNEKSMQKIENIKTDNWKKECIRNSLYSERNALYRTKKFSKHNNFDLVFLCLYYILLYLSVFNILAYQSIHGNF